MFAVLIAGFVIAKKNKVTVKTDNNVLIIQRYWKKYLKRKQYKIQDKIQSIRLHNLLKDKLRIFILKRVLISWKEYTVSKRNNKMKEALESCNDDYFLVDV